MTALSKTNRTLLATIVTAMSNAAAPYSMQTAKSVKTLVDAGLVEQNPDITEGDKIATRATDAGMTANSEPATDAASTTTAAPAFATGSGFDFASISKTTRKRGSRYDFDGLAVGGYIFVPNSDDMPNAAKSLASTVTTANARYAEEIPGETKTNRKGETVPATKPTRFFEVYPVEAGKSYGSFVPDSDGAAIVRTDKGVTA